MVVLKLSGIPNIIKGFKRKKILQIKNHNIVFYGNFKLF